MALFADKTVSDLVPKDQKLVTLKVTDTVAAAVGTLKTRMVTSAPVVDAKGRFEGVLDILDILCFLCIVDKLPSSELTHGTGAGIKLTVIQIRDSEDIERIAKRSAEEIMGLSTRNAFVTSLADASMRSAIQLFAQGVHRLPLVNSAGELVAVASQSDAIRYLATSAQEALGERLKKTPRELGIVQAVRTVNENDTAISAFIYLQSTGLSALGVVDNDGALIGNLSATDLRLLYQFDTRWASLTQSVSGFLNLRKRDPATALITRRPLVAVSLEDSLEVLIGKVLKDNVHRIYISDLKRHPIGVVALVDILRLLAWS